MGNKQVYLFYVDDEGANFKIYKGIECITHTNYNICLSRAEANIQIHAIFLFSCSDY